MHINDHSLINHSDHSNLYAKEGVSNFRLRSLLGSGNYEIASYAMTKSKSAQLYGDCGAVASYLYLRENC